MVDHRASVATLVVGYLSVTCTAVPPIASDDLHAPNLTPSPLNVAKVVLPSPQVPVPPSPVEVAAAPVPPSPEPTHPFPSPEPALTPPSAEEAAALNLAVALSKPLAHAVAETAPLSSLALLLATPSLPTAIAASAALKVTTLAAAQAAAFPGGPSGTRDVKSHTVLATVNATGTCTLYGHNGMALGSLQSSSCGECRTTCCCDRGTSGAFLCDGLYSCSAGDPTDVATGRPYLCTCFGYSFTCVPLAVCLQSALISHRAAVDGRRRLLDAGGVRWLGQPSDTCPQTTCNTCNGMLHIVGRSVPGSNTPLLVQIRTLRALTAQRCDFCVSLWSTTLPPAQFDFMGYPGGNFSLYSDPSHQINMLLDDFGMPDVTFIKALSLLYGPPPHDHPHSQPWRCAGVGHHCSHTAHA